MRSEIHRMNLKLQSLLREKEEPITEMERCVDRRGNIGAKARLQAKKGTNHTQSIRKEVMDLKKRVKTALSDIRLCEEEIDLKQQRQDEVHHALRERQERFRALRQHLDELASMKRQKMRQRMHNLEDVVDAQAALKHYQAVTKGSLKLRFKDVSSYERSIDKQMTTLQHLGAIIDYLVREYPDLEESFASVRDTLGFKLSKFRRATADMRGADGGDDDIEEDATSMADTTITATSAGSRRLHR
ncbi:hypothetical protein PTSG_05961 [Salpingoeca rosetta]|uniref:Uncharacterized protein n=1 Tax=Salpingoeca rosetta (strain ATCC 50818 / BSB-021) TaxID=946362 RepID=F2UDA1_SALR5|nr:uncharacterized protein PTSG_05961 [Salpingoeca rosetta]EGD74596.1 hypothetical protein PTSG_05961 [Salpingoeca rosetta]|eukprot:XP_004992853.1 hypothetical protein PTSG_05961 [Salpingoeca rosetta]